MPYHLLSKTPWLALCVGMILVACDKGPPMQASDRDCSPPPAPPPGIERFVEANVAALLSQQGHVMYEGSEPNARPLPKVSLRALAAELKSIMLRLQYQGDVERNAIVLTFHVDSAPSREPDVITLSKPDLWCLLRRGDTVLLSNGDVSHITKVFSINRATQKVLIADRWPEQFFMLKGHNASEFSAELVNLLDILSLAGAPEQKPARRLVQIDRDQFMKVVVGSITADTPNFIHSYFASHPAARGRSDAQLAFGAALLDWGNESFVEESIEPLTVALRQYREAGPKEQELYSANRLHFALLLHYYAQVAARNQAGAEAAIAQLRELWARYGKEEIVKRNRAIDNYVIGLEAIHARDLHWAIEFFGRALLQQADYHEAYYQRAVARVLKGDIRLAIDDASDVLRLIDKGRLALAETRRTRLSRDSFGQQVDAERQTEFDSWEWKALLLRGTAYLTTGLDNEALDDGRRLIAMRPTAWNGYEIMARAQRDMGDHAGARQSLAEALRLVVDTSMRTRLLELLGQLDQSKTQRLPPPARH